MIKFKDQNFDFCVFGARCHVISFCCTHLAGKVQMCILICCSTLCSMAVVVEHKKLRGAVVQCMCSTEF